MILLKGLAPIILVLVVFDHCITANHVGFAEVDHPPGIDVLDDSSMHDVSHDSSHDNKSHNDEDDDDDFYIDTEIHQQHNPSHHVEHHEESHVESRTPSGLLTRSSSTRRVSSSYSTTSQSHSPQNSNLVSTVAEYNDGINYLNGDSHHIDHDLHHIDHELHHIDSDLPHMDHESHKTASFGKSLPTSIHHTNNVAHIAEDYHVETTPHVEEYVDSYIDTSDPTNPKQVHVEKKSKSIVKPNGASHEHYESKSSTSLSGNPYHHSSTTSLSSSSSSSSSSSYSSSSRNIIPDSSIGSKQAIRHPLTPLPPLRPKLPVHQMTGDMAVASATATSYGSPLMDMEPIDDISSRHLRKIPTKVKYLSRKNAMKLRRRIEAAQKRLERTPY